MDEHIHDFLFDDESEEVIRRYEQAMQNPDQRYFDVEELETIADYYLLCGMPNESSQAIDLGLKLHPNNSTLQMKRAKVYLASGKARKALQLLDRIHETDNPEITLLRGEILLHLHRDAEAHAVIAGLLSTTDIEMEYLCLEIAYVYIASDHYDYALHYLEKGLQQSPQDIDLLQEAALCYEQQGHPETAVAYYDRIIAIDPYSCEAWFNLGLVYFNMKEFELALDAFDFVTVIDEEDFGGWIQKGNVLFQLERYEAALQCYRMCENNIIFMDILHVFIGECYEKLERYETAKRSYREALKINEFNTEAWTGLGICYLELDAPEKSINYFLKSLHIDPANSETWVYLAEAYVNINRMKEAISAYRQSLKLEYEQADTWLALGNLYADSEHYQQALDCYLVALEQNNTLENLHLFLAITCFKLGDIDKTLSFLEEAIRRDANALTLFWDFCPDARDMREE